MAKFEHTNYDSRDVAKLRNSLVVESVDADMRFDSVEDASVFFARQLDYVKQKSYDVQYPELTALSYFPMSNDADPGAETITYYAYDKTGTAKIIDNYSTDLPRADAVGTPTTVQIKSLGTSYGYSSQELRAARLANKPLNTMKAESARWSIDSSTNTIAWRGDTESGIMGVLSDGQSIPYYTVEAGTESGGTKWEDKTADEILADVNGMAKQVAKVTKNVERPDTLFVPSDVYMEMATRRLPNTETTVRDFVIEHSPYIKNIYPASELNSDSTETNPYAADEDGSGVAFLCTLNPNKFTLEIPMPYYQYPTEPRGLETIVACEERLAGAMFYYPLSALIAVGVS